MKESINLSLQELITLSCISESTFLFEHEEVDASNDITSASVDSFATAPTNGTTLLYHNAAKISYLLAKSFSDRYSSGSIDDLSLYSCEDIVVRVKCYSEQDASYRPGLDDSYSTTDAEKDPPMRALRKSASLVSDRSIRVGGRHEVSQKSHHSPSLSTSSFDHALNEIFSEDEYDVNQVEKNVVSKTDVDGNTSDVEEDVRELKTDQSYYAHGRIRTPIFDMLQLRAIDQTTIMCKLHFTLISVDIIQDSLSTSRGQNETFKPVEPSSSAAMQILGKLIQAVFSGDENELPVIHHNSVMSKLEDDIIHIDCDASYLPSHSKVRRNIDKSLFSSLVESGHYPISICRLLSDMIDVGRYGKADSPFASFEEVIDDLEQMSLYPQVFLYDAGKCLSLSSSLLFGQRHYGRVSEVTKILEISTMMEQSAKDGCDDGSAEIVYISGIAGSGKTHLARKAGNFLSSLGWIVIEKKFDRFTEYQSTGVTCCVLNSLVCELVNMKHGSNKEDIEYSQQAEEAILNAFDSSSLPALVGLLPSIYNWIDDMDQRIDTNESQSGNVAKGSHWQVVILCSKILGTFLSLDRFIMIILDDLQWCDPMLLQVIKATLVSVSQNKHEMQHLLLVGTYRSNEIHSDHALTKQILELERSKGINLTQMKVQSLSINDVSDMTMTEMRLPRRLVLDLANVIHKKTSGHAIYIVELLNSLLRDSTIAYSPQKHRLDWDQDIVSSVKTGDDVASLIISKLSSLKAASLSTLCVLSCFGMKAEVTLLRFFQGSSLISGEGFDLAGIVEEGFVELSGSVVVFAHDLIQQHVYEKMPLDQRYKLHLDIGSYLSAKTILDSSPLNSSSIEYGMGQLYICDGGDDHDDDSPISILSLAGIATNQVNKAGPKFISDRAQQIRFAGWNLHAAKESAAKSNFRTALYCYKNGISFLGDDPWLGETCQLCLELHEGAAFTMAAAGYVEDAVQYANAIICAENVEFEQTLMAHCILLRSLESLGNYDDTTTRGLEVLRRLNFDIPTAPTPQIVHQAMSQTSSIASQYNFGQMSRKPQVIPSKQKNILKIIDSVAVACFRSSSPYLPLVACATVTYSLQHGIFHCEEATSAFVIFGYFKIFLEEKFEEGKQWGDLAIKIIDSSHGHASVRARMYLFSYLYFWYIPIKETRRRLYVTYTLGMRCGDVDSAMHALCIEWGYQLFGGEKLSIVKTNHKEYMKSITKYSNNELSKQTVPRMMTVNELMGIEEDDPFLILEGQICNEAELLVDAELSNNSLLIEAIYMTRFLSDFWVGDFVDALESSKMVTSLASSKMPKITSLFFTVYRGIVAFRLFREGNGKHLLEEGNTVLSKVQSWHQSCNWVENKVLLLQAEYFASKCERKMAKMKYEASIKSARDHGFVHEQGLAYECMGMYLASIIEMPEAKFYFRQAHMCYMQWGALGKAAQLLRDHGLDMNNIATDQHTSKHVRDWDESTD